MILPWRPVEIAGVPILTSLTQHEASRLQALAGGRRVLEIGSAYGYSTVCMAQHAEHVLAIDPLEQYTADELHANLRACGVCDRVTVAQYRSQDLLPILAAAGAKFGLVFIDGDHERLAVAADLANAVRLLAPRGVLACHDYGEDSCPGVREAIDTADLPGEHELVDTLSIWRAR